jgi:hypothetical protein
MKEVTKRDQGTNTLAKCIKMVNNGISSSQKRPCQTAGTCYNNLYNSLHNANINTNQVDSVHFIAWKIGLAHSKSGNIETAVWLMKVRNNK